MSAKGWPRCTACRQGNCNICTGATCACWCEGRKRRSVHCAVGQHDRCQDGAAIACHCSCHRSASATTSSVEATPPAFAAEGVVGGAERDGQPFGEVRDGSSFGPSTAQKGDQPGGKPGLIKECGALSTAEPSVPMCSATLPDPHAELVAFVEQEAERVKAQAETNGQSDWWDGYAFGMAQAATMVASLAKRQAERELDFAEGRF